MAEERIAPCIYRWRYGFRVMVRVRGRLITRKYPPSTTIQELKDFRDELRVEAKKRHAGTDRRGTLSADVDRYLRAVRAMPSYADRARDLAAWVEVFGHRARASLQPHELRAQLQTWRAGSATRKPLAASTCNHRRTALGHLYRVLDGNAAVSPIRDVPRFQEPPASRRGIPMADVVTILDQMPDTVTRARLEVIAWTGMRPSELMAVQPDDVDLARGTVQIHGATKGAEGREIAIAGRGVDAWTRFIRLEAWFSRGPSKNWLSGAKRDLHKACDRAGLPRIRPYDLRHSFATALRQVADLADVQAHLGHRSIETTMRYAPTASEKVRAAVERVGKVG